MSISLDEARKISGAQVLSYTKAGGKGRSSTVNHIAWEGDEATVVHSQDKHALAGLLLDWRGMRHTGMSLVEFGSRRGFNIKTAPQE